MKTIGLLGGMSWESTVEYYRAINEGVKNVLGGLHSAKIILYSVDFEPLERRQHQDDWAGAAKILCDAAVRVQDAGADFLVVCTNTMHKVAPDIESAIDIPLLHIADATARVLIADGVAKVGLLGTAFTMEKEFYKGRLQGKHGLEVVIPGTADRKLVHDVIYRELCLGRVLETSKKEYLRIIRQLTDDGAEAVILGCTEIGMLVGQQDTDVKLYDTTAIHAQKAVEYAVAP
jgi:aspartate racemase